MKNTLRTIEEKEDRTKKTYNKISKEVRQILISKTVYQKLTVAQASRQLNLNPSTAKMIVKKFKEEGIIFQKKSDRFQRKIIEEERKRIQNENKQNQIFQVPPLSQIHFYPSILSYCLSYIPENQIT